MKRVNIRCPYCGSRAFLRPASVVYGAKAIDPAAPYYVCARYSACDSYVAAHRESQLPMGTLANRALRQKRRRTHLALNRLWEQGYMTRKEAYRWLQIQLGLPESEAHIGRFSEFRCQQVIDLCNRLGGILMSKYTYYTAIGHFRRKTDDQGRSYPVILINQKEYRVDIQEMALWTALNWRLLEFSQIEAEYDRLDRDCSITARRTLEDCLGRLCTRGLVASGTGETDFEALYDLLGGLYVVPLSESVSLRLAAFLKLTILKGVSVARAWELFRQDRPSEREAQVMMLTAGSRDWVTEAIANLYLRKQIIFERV